MSGARGWRVRASEAEKQRSDAIIMAIIDSRFGPDRTVDGLYDFDARATSLHDKQRPRRLDLVARHENVWGACTSRASEPGKVGYDRRCNCAPNASLPISPLLDRDLIPLTPVATACL